MDVLLKEKFIKWIDELLEKAEDVKATEEPPPTGGGGIAFIGFPATLDSTAFFEWKSSAESLIAQIAGEDSSDYKNFLNEVNDELRSNVDRGIGILKSLRNRLQSGFFDLPSIKDSPTPRVDNSKITEASPVAKTKETKVFVVHGHDEETLSRIESFLKKLQLDPVILREKPNKGLTIIEKFLEFSNQTGFAVVLLTPDDRGGSKLDTYKKQRFRARQNVILELGFFLGKLGREHLCVLHKQDVEIPSDYHGVLYVELDESGAWKMNLAKEMKTAGLDVDLNQLVK